jgi:hypothetical protein
METIRRVRFSGPVAPLSASLLAFALLAAACSTGTLMPTAVPTPVFTRVPAPVVAGPLMTVQTRGGMCPGAPCGTTLILERDGRVHLAAKPPNDLGTVPPATLAALDAAIRSTDFVALKSHPFTGQCPTDFDGQETVYEFGAPDGVQTIATCEVAVDFGSPLFVAVAAALGPFIPLPTT